MKPLASSVYCPNNCDRGAPLSLYSPVAIAASATLRHNGWLVSLVTVVLPGVIGKRGRFISTHDELALWQDFARQILDGDAVTPGWPFGYPGTPVPGHDVTSTESRLGLMIFERLAA